MRKSILTLAAATVAAVIVLAPNAAYAHGGEEPLSEETTSAILDTGSKGSALGPALIGGGVAAGAAALFLLLRRRPASTPPTAETADDQEPSDPRVN